MSKKFNRAMHFDFHTMPNIENLFGNFNAEQFAEKLKENHVEYINFTARCNIGFSYYNTKVGKKYPGLTRDVLKEVLDSCHARGIGVTAYINAGLNHEGMAEHADWCRMDKNGVVYKQNKTDNFFRFCCYNSGFGERLIEEIKEIAAYDVDGIFCDCMKDAECYCTKCVEKMKAEGVDMTNSAEVMEFQHETKMAIAERIKKEALKVAKRNIKFFFNSVPWKEYLDTHAEIECLTNSPVWGYDYFYAVAPYARTRFNDLVYMSGRFQNCWGDFGGIKPLASMQNDLYDAMMNGFGISFGDHLHPIDGLENEVIERVGKVFAEKILYEPFDRNAVAVCDIAVLAEEESYTADPYLQGICKMLSELKMPYNIYNEYGKWDDVKLLIVPKNMPLSENMKNKLLNFHSEGGKIIFLGDAVITAKLTGLLNYAEIIGRDESDNAYFTYGEKGMRWATYCPSMLIKNISGRELSRYVDKIFNFDFDGRHAYFYRPQGNESEYSAAIVGDNGTACICFDLSLAYKQSFLVEQKKLFKDIVDILYSNRLIRADDLPAYATVAITENELNRIVHVKADFPETKMCRGIIEDHVYLKSSIISVKGEYEVFVLPELKKIERVIKNGRTEFETGDFSGYRAFSLRQRTNK